MTRSALVILLALAATASTAARRDPLEGYVPGKPVNCIPLQTQASGPQIVDDHTILYRFTGRRIWRTGPVGRCPALAPQNTLITEIYGGQLCRNDRFRVLEPQAIIPSAYCRFDLFTPYTKPGR